jgi:hypothetical protein
LLQCRHSRRLRIASPVSDSRESTTFESAVPQKGHFIAAAHVRHGMWTAA